MTAFLIVIATVLLAWGWTRRWKARAASAVDIPRAMAEALVGLAGYVALAATMAAALIVWA